MNVSSSIRVVACLLLGACDPGWSYRIPDRRGEILAQGEPPTYSFQLAGGAVGYRVRSLFFAGGIHVWSVIENRGEAPITFRVREASVRTADGQELPLDGLFEGEEIKTGFYAEANRGHEFRTGVKTIAPGEAYSLAHRFGRLPAFEGGLGMLGGQVNPRLLEFTFVSAGLESKGQRLTLSVRFKK
jgi:hypothetical protein